MKSRNISPELIKRKAAVHKRLFKKTATISRTRKLSIAVEHMSKKTIAENTLRNNRSMQSALCRYLKPNDTFDYISAKDDEKKSDALFVWWH